MPISQIFTSIQPPTKSFKELTSIHALLEQFGWVSQNKFTGQLTLKIQGIQGQQWSLDFYLGRLIWATDQMHPMRRWYRQLALHCPNLVVEPVRLSGTSPLPGNDAVLARLVRQEEMSQQKGEAIVSGHIEEILFDIFQQWTHIYNSSTLQVSYRYRRQSESDLPLTAIPVERAWFHSSCAWSAWRQVGLANYSPNQSPLLWDAERLRQILSPMAYQSLAALVDGRRTLRDLAVKSRQDLQLMTQSIIPQVHQGSIRLITVEDLQAPLQSVVRLARRQVSSDLAIGAADAFSINSAPLQARPPLIAHIDDHTLHARMMGHILAHLNYRFIHLPDPVQALIQLLEYQPNLILLDLAMPIVNGYELCARIRRVSTFKDIPIIIVSSNDTLVERIQAKMAGATDFLSKPVRLKKVQPIVQRYLATDIATGVNRTS